MTKCLRSRIVLVVPMVSLPLLITGCPGLFPPSSADDGSAELRRFGSEDELLSYFKEQVLAEQTRSGRSFEQPLALGAAPAAEGGAAGAEDATQGGGSSYSTTNLQEADVDESDIIKSDGTYFYIARGDSIRIVQALPTDELAEVGRVDLDVHLDSLYLADSKLIVLGQRFATGRPEPSVAETLIWPPYYEDTSVLIYEVDVTDPANPAVSGQIELDGSLVSSRLTGGRLVIVLTVVPDLPQDPTRPNVSRMALDQVLPKTRRGDAQETMVGWQDFYRPGSPDGYRTTAVVTLDAADVERILGSVAIMADAGTIYSSAEALYVSDADYDPQDNYRELTVIHKLAYKEDGTAQYVGTGKVPGRLLNQFSLGEHEGCLRVATHVVNSGFFGLGGVGFDVDEGVAAGTAEVDGQPEARRPTGPYNALYVLSESEQALKVVGSIEDIAPGERLYAARFMGDRGFLVTFEQIDPLFVLDLSEPTSPQVLGELKIPGYSDYLHPFGDDLLIGVGRAVGETPWGFAEPRGVQLSLFDVSDPSAPTVVQQLELGSFYSSSDVSQTHKAFTFLADEGLLAIPARLTAGDLEWGHDHDIELTFDGVLCYRVTAEGFEELGRVAAVGSDNEPYRRWGAWGWGGWRRAAFIGETVYAVTEGGVRAAPRADFDATTTLELADDSR